MISEGKVGIQTAADGSQVIARAGRTGELIVTQGHSAFAESALRGAIMIASNAVAGVAPGTALSTTPPLALWNPPSSGKNLVILKVGFGYVSGTLGAGSILLAGSTSQTTVPSSGTELTPVCSLFGMPRGVGRVFTGSTIVTPTIIRPVFQLGAYLATTAWPPINVVEQIDGELIVTPGTIVCLQEIGAAGSTPLGVFSFTYEEVPI